MLMTVNCLCLIRNQWYYLNQNCYCLNHSSCLPGCLIHLELNHSQFRLPGRRKHHDSWWAHFKNCWQYYSQWDYSITHWSRRIDCYAAELIAMLTPNWLLCWPRRIDCYVDRQRGIKHPERPPPAKTPCKPSLLFCSFGITGLLMTDSIPCSLIRLKKFSSMRSFWIINVMPSIEKSKSN